MHGCRPGVVSAVEEFKLSVYGDNYDEENELVRNGKASEASKKRKAIADNAVKECANYNWADLADNGQVKLEVSLLSYFIPSGLFWDRKENLHCFNSAFACKVVELRLEQVAPDKNLHKITAIFILGFPLINRRILAPFVVADANQRETFELFYFDKVKLSRPLSGKANR
jgi:hypothetical protein